MKRVLGCIRRADERYRMIHPGDKICVGVSGGKDSLLLLYGLKLYQKFCHTPFELIGVMLDLGISDQDYQPVADFAESIGVPFEILKTDIGDVVFNIRQESHPCALCAKMRRGMLCDMSKDLGCNKLALGHHREDALETLMMSVIFEGRLHTFHPCSYMSRSNLTVIRPLIYVPEKHIIHMRRELDLPVIKNPCPANGHTKRQEMKDLLSFLCKRYPNLKESMLSALKNEAQYGLWNRSAPGVDAPAER